MKNQYYLVSQLPDISAAGEKSALPITEKYYRDLCSRFFDDKQKLILDKLSVDAPRLPESTGSDFLDTWYEKERNLRFALAQIRSQKMKKDAYTLPAGCTADIISAARTAVGMDSPYTAEGFLFEYRIKLLDNLRPLDSFSIDAVYSYGIKLMLVERMRKFDVENGKQSYHKIYDSILGDTL